MSQPLPRLRQARAAVLLSVALVILVSVVRWFLADAVPESTPYLLFVASVAIVAYLCGWKYGLLTLGLSLLAGSYLFARPMGSLALADKHDVLSAGIFVIASGVILLAFRAEAAARQGIIERDARLRQSPPARRRSDAGEPR